MKSQPFNLSNPQFNQSNVNVNYQLTGVTHNDINYVEISQFASYFNVDISVSTLRRLLKKVEHQDCYVFFLRIENKLFLSRSILTLRDENFSRIQQLTGNWYSYLAALDWDFFGHVSFSAEYKCATAKDRMEKFYNKLSNRFNTDSFTIFYACEKNTENNGYHAHFLLKSSLKDKQVVKNFTENHFRGNTKRGWHTAITKMNKFINDFGAEEYILKEIHLNPDGFDYHIKNPKLKQSGLF